MSIVINKSANQSEDIAYNKLITAIENGVKRLDHSALFFTNHRHSLYDIFLDALPEEYRQKHNCRTCRNFIDKWAAVVSIDEDGKFITIFDGVESEYEPFNAAVSKIQREIKKASLGNPVFGSYEGVPILNGYNHMHGDFNGIAVNDVGAAQHIFNQEVEAVLSNIQSYYRETILEDGIIVLKGSESHKAKTATANLERHIQLRDAIKDLFSRCRRPFINRYVAKATDWKQMIGPGLQLNNTALGEFLDSMETHGPNSALRLFDSMTDSTVYMQTTATPSDTAFDAAEKKIKELGLEIAFDRRIATPNDAKDYLVWAATSNTSESGGLFDGVRGKAKKEPVRLEQFKDITAKELLEKILPEADSVFVDTLNIQSMGSIVVPSVPHDDAILFKYGTNVSWFVVHEEHAQARGTFHIERVYRSPACEFDSGKEYDGLFFQVRESDMPGKFRELFQGLETLGIFPELLRRDLYNHRHAIQRLSDSRKMKMAPDSIMSRVVHSHNCHGFMIYVTSGRFTQPYRIVKWS